MIELVNSLMMKKLFTLSSRVRFLIPIPYKSLEGQRGKAVKDHIKMLLHVFKGNIKDVATSIQPVLTQVKPRESNFDLHTVQGNIKLQIDAMLKNHFRDQYQMTPDEIKLISTDGNTELPNSVEEIFKVFIQKRKERQDRQQDVMDIEEFKQICTEVNDINQFVHQFVCSIAVCDPLDRKILAEYDESDEDQDISQLRNEAIKVSELMDKIKNLTPIQGS